MKKLILLTALASALGFASSAYAGGCGSCDKEQKQENKCDCGDKDCKAGCEECGCKKK